jgi:ketosteroid isomerase-like protein
MYRTPGLPTIIVTLAVFGGVAQAHAHAGPTDPLAPVSAASVSSGPDVDAIRAVGVQWQALYSAGRYAEIPELYTEDTMVMPRGRPRIQGRDAMRRAIGGLAAGRRVSIDMTEREAFVIGDYGWFVGDFRVTYSPVQPGAASVSENGRSLIIFRRDTDGRWRVHRDIDSPAPDGAPTAATATATAASESAVASSARQVRDLPPIWDPASRTEVTACDQMTASRYDRTRLAEPRARDQIDVPVAIATCEADLVRFPNDPRLHFQLGRVYGYAGDVEKTLFHRRASAAGGNPNAIFLLGYLDWTAATDDGTRCAAADQMKLSADRGNYSAQITYASFYLEQKFAPCPGVASASEVRAYLAGARPVVDGFFETRFADHLIGQMDAVLAVE